MSGKPISRVQEIINSVPRGNIQLIAKSSKISEEILRRKSNAQFVNVRQDLIISKQTANDLASPKQAPFPESVFSTESDFQVVSPPPPPVFDQSTIADSEQQSRNLRYHHLDQLDGVSKASFRDDVSDMESLPSAPPRPVLPLNVHQLDRRLDDVDESFAPVSPPPVFGEVQGDDSDNDSIFTALPPPPPKPQIELSNQNPAGHSSQYGDFQSRNSDRGSNHDSEATIRGQCSQSATSSSESESSLVPPPRRLTNLNLSLVQEKVYMSESQELVHSNIYDVTDSKDLRARSHSDDLDDKSALCSIPEPPGAPSMNGASNEAAHPMDIRGVPEGAPSRSHSFVSNNGSVSSALNFLDSTLLTHTDSTETPVDGSVNSRLLSPPIWNTGLESSSQDFDDDASQASLLNSKPYGSYTDLTKDTPTHIPIIMGDHMDTERYIGKKKGLLTKLKKRFLSSNKSKLDSPNAKDSKGREIVHVAHDKAKSQNIGEVGMRSASSIQDINDAFSEGGMKRTASLDEQSLRMINDPTNAAHQDTRGTNTNRWSLVSSPAEQQIAESLENMSLKAQNVRNKGLSLESGIDRVTDSNHEKNGREIDIGVSPSKGNRRRSSAAMARRMSRTSPPHSPAPPPPVDSSMDEKDGKRSRTSSFTSRLSSSLGDLTRKFHRSDSDRSERGRKNSQGSSSNDGPYVPKKPSVKKKPSSPLLNRIRSIGRSSKPGSPANSRRDLEARKESYIVDQYGSASSSSTFSEFEEPIAGTTMESVARRKQASKQSLMKFDFPPPPATDDSSGDASSDLSTKKGFEDGYSPRERKWDNTKHFSTVPEGRETELNIGKKSNRTSSIVSTGPQSVIESEGWGSDFSDGESVRHEAPSQSDLTDPKLQPFSVPLSQVSPDFRLRTKTAPRFDNRKEGSAGSNINHPVIRRSGNREVDDLSEFKTDSSIPNGSPVGASNAKPQPLNRANSLEVKRGRDKHMHKVETDTPIKLKSPLFNIFGKKDVKLEKKTKEKGSKLSALFHSKRPQPRGKAHLGEVNNDADHTVDGPQARTNEVPESKLIHPAKFNEAADEVTKPADDDPYSQISQSPDVIDGQGMWVL